MDVYLDAARSADLRITHVVETHLHNDYVSGGRDLAALTGATHVIGAGAELRYEHAGLPGGAGFDVGRLRFEVLDTPGHTPEHVSYRVADGSVPDDPGLLLSGGSILVGAVGRTDLLGADHAVPYAHDMYHSIHDTLLPLGDPVHVHPTHGAGSLCSTGIGDASSTTIGHERSFDPLLAPMDIDAFARALLAGQPAIPRYFARMRPLNQAGPPLLGGVVPTPPPLDPAAVEAAVAAGATHRRRTARGRPCRGAHRGLDLDPARGLVRDLARLGGRPGPAGRADRGTSRGPRSDHAAGDPHRARRGRRPPGRRGGGVGRVRAPGRDQRAAVDRRAGRARWPARAPPTPRCVIDVRQMNEYAAGHVPGAWHINGGSLPDRLADLPRDRPIAVICEAGFRASIGTSLLRASGFDDASWVGAGFPAWRDAGLPVETGEGR